jgi:prepilin-type N-terminal cleavage/methylation domain-containing protein
VKKRGMTLVELMVAMGLMSLTFAALSAMFLFGLRSYQKTAADTTLNQTNAQGLRRIAETIRQAMSVTISSDGRILTYTLPRLSAAADPVTGEKEYQIPLVNDGVARSFTVNTSGNVVDTVSGRVLVRNVRLTDPDAASSQYNQTYQPFSLSNIGSQRAVTVNLITSENVLGDLRYARLKTTVVLRNK